MHDLIFERRKMKIEDLEGYAEELGLDMERFRADMNSEAVEAKIKEDQA
ncbi:MAG: hypothetical protein D6795_07830, partial [Deltaproteobacteria bacterium]